MAAKTFRQEYLELVFDRDGKLGVQRDWFITAQVAEGYFLRTFPIKRIDNVTPTEALNDLSSILDRVYSNICFPLVYLTLSNTLDESDKFTISRDEDNTTWLLRKLLK